MAVPTLISILKKILKQPTAPFHEQYVRAEIEALLKDCPHVKMKRDKYGNVIATYKHGKRKPKPTWVLAAHMDHPAFVKTPGSSTKDDWQFLGGVGEAALKDGIKRKLRKPHKSKMFATWDFPVKIDSERIEGPACDDLIGCAAIVAVFWQLASLGLEAEVHAVFTRAEEVGWLGAWHLGKRWPFKDSCVFLSIECSRPVNGAEFGVGPIIRVGDRLSVFDAESVSILMRTASEQGIRVQRCLLDKGACEATAMQALGIRSAGISVPLGNYHNTTDEGKIAPEYVMMDDLKGMVTLMNALVATKHVGIGERTIQERVAMREIDYRPHLEEANSVGNGR